ncbi:MAG: hypothetical protein JXA81_03150 [Sedimentisphaerales bacterium]|nr:hypothetical protein [Sedimentisphaerales bacterium]
MEESNIDYNMQNDNDVLRAEDIVPPYNTQKSVKQALGDKTPSLNAGQSQHNVKNMVDADDKAEIKEIPKFDLAGQILAEQRKIISVRRKAPGGKPKLRELQPRMESVNGEVKQPPAVSVTDPVISDIVARDIEKLYRADRAVLRDW